MPIATSSTASTLPFPGPVLPEPLQEERELVLARLRAHVSHLEQSGKRLEKTITSGCSAIDGLLPHGGYVGGSIVEWLCQGSGTGGTYLALQTAKQAMHDGKYLLVVDKERRFYPVAASALGIPMERVIVVHPHSHADGIWAMDQGLRCAAVGAVFSEVACMDPRDARRLQLAAEEGGGLGLLIRSTRQAQDLPSWSEVQWRVEPRASWDRTTPHRLLDLELKRCRGGRPGAKLSVLLHGTSGEVLEYRSPSVQPSPFSIHSQEKSSHASKSALCLASELAMPTRSTKRPDLIRSPIRASSA